MLNFIHLADLMRAIYKAWLLPANKPNFADKTAANGHWPVNCTSFKKQDDDFCNR